MEEFLSNSNCYKNKMIKKYLFFFILITMLAYSCRRKHVPSKTSETSSLPVKNDSVIIRKKIFKPRQKDIIPNAIIVNDKVARKSVDGRLYYDLLGHRY